MFAGLDGRRRGWPGSQVSNKDEAKGKGKDDDSNSGYKAQHASRYQGWEQVSRMRLGAHTLVPRLAPNPTVTVVTVSPL